MQNKEDKEVNFQYYHEYCRLYLAKTVLLTQLRELFNQKNDLINRFSKLEKKGDEINRGQKGDDDRKKRFRRTASEIQRHYRCSVETCQKSYGSEGSLHQHIKIKHPQLYIELGLGSFPCDQSMVYSMKESEVI